MAIGMPRVVVVNGGPGLGSSYMRQGLKLLESRISLRFFDQPGCGADVSSNGEVSLEATVRALERIYEEEAAADAPGILVHSWGTVPVLLAALRSLTRVRDAKIFFCNPCPLTATRNKAASARLTSRIQPTLLPKMNDLVAAGSIEAGAEWMRLAMPAYCSPSSAPTPLSFDFSFGTFATIAHDLGDYDIRSAVHSLSGPFAVLTCADDFIVRSDVDELVVAADSCMELRGAGHFPFVEVPTATFDNIFRFFGA